MQTPPLLNLPSNPQFQTFWEAYPKKMAKADAEKAFNKAIRLTTLDEILVSILAHKKTRDWQKEKGAFVPYPASWLNQRHWQNTLTSTTEAEKSKPELSPMQLQVHNGEYLRILEAMKSISHSYSEHQSWSKEDKTEFQKLKTRRNQLRLLLGIMR